jgi:hypothetical protein
MRVFKRMCCKRTVLFAAARFYIWLQRRIVSVIRSRVRETSANGPRILSLGIGQEWSVFRQRYAWVSFNRRKHRYFVFPTIYHYFIDGDNFDIVSPFILFPCTRRLITQYFRFYSVVRFNMDSCAEHGAHSYVPSMFRVTKTYTAARIWKCTLIGRCVTEDSRRIPPI